MLYRVMLYYVMLCYVVLYYIILCYVILWYVILYYIEIIHQYYLPCKIPHQKTTGRQITLGYFGDVTNVNEHNEEMRNDGYMLTKP